MSDDFHARDRTIVSNGCLKTAHSPHSLSLPKTLDHLDSIDLWGETVCCDVSCFTWSPRTLITVMMIRVSKYARHGTGERQRPSSTSSSSSSSSTPVSRQLLRAVIIWRVFVRDGVVCYAMPVFLFLSNTDTHTYRH